VLESLITDRTEDDLSNDADKAYIAYTDLNRLEDACAYLAECIGVSIQTKKWEMEDFRTASEMKRLLNNIKKIRDAFFTKDSTPDTPSVITFSNIYQANDIEQILKDIGDMYDSMVSGEQRVSFQVGTKLFGNRLTTD
jgi:hypothetical protein